MIRISLIAAIALGVASPAISGPAQIAIKVADSDLDTRAGRARLRRQISGAIEELCGSYASTESYQWDQLDDCRRKAWANSSRQLAALRAARSVKIGAR